MTKTNRISDKSNHAYWKLNIYVIIIVVFILLALGEIEIFSVTSIDLFKKHHSIFEVVSKQLLYIVGSVIFAGFLIFRNFGLRICNWNFGKKALSQFDDIKKLNSKQIVIRNFLKNCTFATCLTVIMGLIVIRTSFSESRGGNSSWIGVSQGTSIQPSEFAKLALIIFLAICFSNLYEDGEHIKVSGTLWKVLLYLPIILGVVLLIGGVIRQRDLGTAIIMILILFAVLFFNGVKLQFFFGVFALFAVAVAILVIGSSNRLERFTVAYTGQCQNNMSDICRQYNNARFAFANGGIKGLGIGASKEKWGHLSAADSDFIFSVIGEDFGFLGCCVVLLLFLLLIYMILRTISRTDDIQSRLIAGGIISWVFFQTIINMGMTIGIFPIIGVPLPFVSRGGSSIISLIIATGFIISICVQNMYGDKKALKTPQKGEITISTSNKNISKVGENRQIKHSFKAINSTNQNMGNLSPQYKNKHLTNAISRPQNLRSSPQTLQTLQKNPLKPLKLKPQINKPSPNQTPYTEDSGVIPVKFRKQNRG